VGEMRKVREIGKVRKMGRNCKVGIAHQPECRAALIFLSSLFFFLFSLFPLP
jgi:hypothetical protein